MSYRLAIAALLFTLVPSLAHAQASTAGRQSQVQPLSWAPGQNLAGGSGAIPIFSVGSTALTTLTITCHIETAVGGTATIDVRYAASTTALTSGTSLLTAPCNANTAGPTNPSVTWTGAAVPAGNTLGIVAAGAGWASSAGAGSIQVAF